MKQLILFALFCLTAQALAASPVTVSETAPRRIMLVIGIGAHDDPRWPKLQFAEKDARDFYNSLSAQNYGGMLLTSSEVGGKGITRDSLRDAFKRLAQQNIHEDDTVIVYYSGHGTLAMATDPKTRSFGLRKFFVAADTRLDEIASTGLAQDEILTLFQQLKSRRKALIIDACHAGGGKAYLSPSVLELFAMQKGPSPRDLLDEAVEGSGIFTASASGEEALEMKELQNGIYTHFLIQGMNADMDGDGAVRLSEAHAFASQKVLDYTRNSQHPTANLEFVGKDPVVVSGEATREGGPILYAWQWALRKYDVYVDGKKRGSLGKGGLPVPDGTRQLTLRDPETNELVLDRVVQFKTGSDYSVADYFVPRTPNALSASAVMQRWMGPETGRSLPGSVDRGFALSYTRQEIWGSRDLVVRYSHIPKRSMEARITIDLAGRIFEMPEEQWLTQHRMDLGLGSSEKWSSWSRRSLGLDTVAFVQGGAAGLLLRRELPGFAAGERDRQVFLPGAWAQTGLQLRFERGRLLLTTAVEASVFKNQLGHEGPTTQNLGFQLGLGSYW